MGIYEPAEDSYLLQKHVRDYALGRVLDMGTGSGILALTAITNPNAQQVLAIDQDDEVVKKLQEKIKKERIRKLEVRQSDLFLAVKEQFNLIIFNPPYLPQDEGVTDKAIYGGKKGWEIADKFFHDVSCHLYPSGKILLLFSSLTNKQKIEEIISHHQFLWKEIDSMKVAFEELYVYEVWKTPLLRDLEAKGIGSVQYYTKGKRGEIYTGFIDRSVFVKKFVPLQKDLVKVAIKVEHPESKAIGRIENETTWLSAVNPKGIGPLLLFSGEGYLVMEFIEGERIDEWIEKHTRKEQKQIIAVLVDVLGQCFLLDKIGVTKEEMHHPGKHIIINVHTIPVMIDFERCSRTEHPKNVTQFIEFVCRISSLLATKGIIINVDSFRMMAKEYKDSQAKDVFAMVIDALHKAAM